MKKTNIGKLEFDICENVFDINDYRFCVMKQYLLKSFENMDYPLFMRTHAEATKILNEGKPYNAFLKYEDFKHSIENKNDDSISICFALMCIEKDENQLECSESKMKEKLERMRKEGLTRGMVEDTVKDFIIASPNSFGDFAEMLKLMKTLETLS